ncbi:MAG: DNA-directed RNA polymerase subunit RpoH/Rpb5 C-terminal domain-containing protein [Acidimicrobiales bacterium]
MDISLLFNIYKNIYIMLSKYRIYNIKTEQLSSEQFNKTFSDDSYVYIQSATPDNISHITIMISPSSPYYLKFPEFKKLLNSKLLSEVDILLFITKDGFNTHFKRQLKNSNKYIEDCTYSLFLIETPLHSLCPTHKIATDEELTILKKYHIDIKMLPKILLSDPMAVWIGLKKGQVCKILRLSEATGESIQYRFCI